MKENTTSSKLLFTFGRRKEHSGGFYRNFDIVDRDLCLHRVWKECYFKLPGLNLLQGMNRIIPHGIATKTFYPVDKEKEYILS